MIILGAFLPEIYFCWNGGDGDFYYTCGVFDDLRVLVVIAVSLVF